MKKAQYHGRRELTGRKPPSCRHEGHFYLVYRVDRLRVSGFGVEWLKPNCCHSWRAKNRLFPFYKNLFELEPVSWVRLDADFWEDDDKVSIQENELLEALFSENEIKTAMFESYDDGAPGPYGFSFMFYQHFWDLIKDDFMNVVRDFEAVNLNIERLNYALITLIPKEPEAKLLKKFRLISLLNCSFKFFGKALNNRLIKIADRLISKNQTTFMQGRFILESVVAAHEIIHDINKNKESGVILKLDY